MPAYTANQADKAAAAARRQRGARNNFSNINATLQARLFSKALRDYPSQYITPDMYRKLIEWLRWNEYINGDNRFPDNNEFFFNWNPATQTLGPLGHPPRRARLVQLDVLRGRRRHPGRGSTTRSSCGPIDMGYDHFTINNLQLPRHRPHGRVAASRAARRTTRGAGGLLGLRRTAGGRSRSTTSRT